VASIRFARNFERHVACPAAAVGGATVGDVLAAYFADHPAVRTYVLDDQGGLRHHVAVFVNETQITDRAALTDTVADHDQIHVLQALSGG
jgi:sulfur carrier protein ThiS